MSDSLEPVVFVAPDPAELAPLFPGYEIQGLIATGGMGAVYCAVQKSLDRKVALKILPRELSKDAGFCAGFEAEAKAMARLNHPNLIGVFDFGEVNGMLFIIMEYVPGKSLFHSANGLAIDPTEVIRLVVGICQGLAHAHANGIIHRDIKPSNVLLDQSAMPKIGDFGLARPIDRQVLEGELVYGTPHYTAPEVVESPRSVDQRADIFSVGVLLHELLTSKLPADDQRPASLIAHCNVRFDDIIRRATQQLPAARYANARDMANDLQAIAASPVAASIRRNAPTPVYAIQAKEKSSNTAMPYFVVAAIVIAIVAYAYNSRKSYEPATLKTAVVASPSAPKTDKTSKPKATPKPKAIPNNKKIPEATPVTELSPSVADHTQPQIPPVAPEPKISVSPASVGPPPVEPTATPMPEETATPNPEPVAPIARAPKYDVAALFDRARKMMKERSLPVVAINQKSLKENMSSFERDSKRQIRKLDHNDDESRMESLSRVVEDWKSQGFRIPENPQLEFDIAKPLKAILNEHLENQVRIDEELQQGFSPHAEFYINGLEKTIEHLTGDDDPAAISLIQNEIEQTKSDPQHFVDLIMHHE